jgi:hypothetical protein
MNGGVDKQHILDEIRRTASQNGGVPLGRARFQAETGISQSDWYAKFWRSWGDAVREAGYEPNVLQSAFDEKDVLEKLIAFIRELARYPVAADLRMKAREDPGFPSHNVFRRLGRKGELAAKVISHCEAQGGFDDVVAACQPIATVPATTQDAPIASDAKFGFVYLLKSGRYHKIGRSRSVGRREYELAIQLPEPATVVHKIKTDDPVGIEEYWHKRFAEKRKGGEWFDLSLGDVAAFKRRKFM